MPQVKGMGRSRTITGERRAHFAYGGFAGILHALKEEAR